MSTKTCLRDMCCLCEEFRATRNEFDKTFVCTCSLNGKGIVIPDVTLITPESWLNGVLNIPSADVQHVNRWISVDDMLPEIDERVLVYIPKPDNHYNTEIAYISEGNDDHPYWVSGDKSQFYSTRFHYISYWMPLPEPPKEGYTE